MLSSKISPQQAYPLNRSNIQVYDLEISEDDEDISIDSAKSEVSNSTSPLLGNLRSLSGKDGQDISMIFSSSGIQSTG